ncbi:dimethyl sulfoxide reductase anchor subunit family protein [Enterovibrio norvegicus]|uniref:Dimethyl sulfoxide reductase n=1 Tax=Enterovibrio norvegicus TaxID=188144 RepID=A0A2N7L791_9GAMM|nr:DmsC/YnfH family molybdoenzyme membrane anchor subunit [Enterovibrio norvegicus]PMN89880.1 dimethyl sulfoxide reductase [Enterovibrio norvegicus]
MSELSLVFFTVLAQSAVGMFIALGFVELFFKPERKGMNIAFMASLALLGLGAMASVTHLGQPFRMFNVMFGLAHLSALSLEIVALSLFGGAAFTYTTLRVLNIQPMLQKLTLPAAMALGVVFILAIVNVYRLPTVLSWNSHWTTFQFLMTAGVVGPIAAAMALRVLAPQLGQTQVCADRALGMTALITMAVSLIGFGGYAVWLGQLEAYTNPFAIANAEAFTMARIGLMASGVVLFASQALRGNNKNAGVTIAAFLMVVMAELSGRAFFYDAFISASSGM